jgi:nicotinamidase-related amidase
MNNSKYFSFLQSWKNELPTLKANDVFQSPDNSCALSVDLVNGFCKSGALYSDRCKNVIIPTVDVFQLACENNVDNFVLVNDAHNERALEFSSYPEHCLANSVEATPVAEIMNLPFFNEFSIFYKNSISPIYTDINKYLYTNRGITTFIVTGVCTDICVYQLSTYLLAHSNETCLSSRIIVPENCVNTYDSENHPGELYHLMFLYSMYLNGIEVVKGIE